MKANDNFTIISKEKINNAAIEFAQMCILFAQNKYPGDLFQQAKLISLKLDEKYINKKNKTAQLGKPFQCAILKFGSGNGGLHYLYEHEVVIDYNNYRYFIWN